VRPGFKRELVNLAHELRPVVTSFYPNYKEDVLGDDKKLEAFVNQLLPNEGLFSPDWLLKVPPDKAGQVS
jgi:hypothetical protein